MTGANSIRFDRRRVIESLGALTLVGYAGRSLSIDRLAPNVDVPDGFKALSCVVTPSATEGPYFIDESLQRSDLTSGTTRPAVLNGVPLTLRVGVYRVGRDGCAALEGAQVDVWHADAAGVYSGIGPQMSVGEKYLRGYQRTDAGGSATFRTIYPGWYPGRTPHIHFKVRRGEQEFTSQWFFDDEISDLVYATAPYSGRGGHTRRNASDRIYRSALLLALEKDAATAGYVGSFSIGLAF